MLHVNPLQSYSGGVTDKAACAAYFNFPMLLYNYSEQQRQWVVLRFTVTFRIESGWFSATGGRVKVGEMN